MYIILLSLPYVYDLTSQFRNLMRIYQKTITSKLKFDLEKNPTKRNQKDPKVSAPGKEKQRKCTKRERQTHQQTLKPARV